MGADQQALAGSWTHSHEEDGEGETVLRRSDYPFPPSRGRLSFELRPDGTYLERSPGPVDVPEESSGSWSLEGDRLTLEPAAAGERRSWRVAALAADRLTLRDP